MYRYKRAAHLESKKKKVAVHALSVLDQTLTSVNQRVVHVGAEWIYTVAFDWWRTIAIGFFPYFQNSFLFLLSRVFFFSGSFFAWLICLKKNGTVTKHLEAMNEQMDELLWNVIMQPNQWLCCFYRHTLCFPFSSLRCHSHRCGWTITWFDCSHLKNKKNEDNSYVILLVLFIVQFPPQFPYLSLKAYSSSFDVGCVCFTFIDLTRRRRLIKVEGSGVHSLFKLTTLGSVFSLPPWLLTSIHFRKGFSHCFDFYCKRQSGINY